MKTRLIFIIQDIITHEETLDSIASGTGEYAPGLAENILQSGGKLRRPRLCSPTGGVGGNANEEGETKLISTNTVSVFPNPAQDQVTFEWPLELVKKKVANLQITNLNGVLIELHTFRKETNSFVWQISGLSTGIYFYQLKFGSGEMYHGKIVVQH